MIRSSLHVIGLLSAVLFAHGLIAWTSPFAETWTVLLLGAAGVAFSASSQLDRCPGRRLTSGVRGVAVFVVAAMAAALAIWTCEQLALRQVAFPTIGSLIGTLMQPFGRFGASALGEISSQARDGRLLFEVSTVKLGVGLIGYLAAHAAATLAFGSLTVRRTLYGVLGMCAVLVVHLAVEIALYGDISKVLLQHFPSHLTRFSDVVRQIPWMLVAGITLIASGWRVDPPPAIDVAAASTIGLRERILCSVTVVLGALVALCALDLRLPDREGKGVVVVDDLHSEYWAAAGRRMNEDWYGDFSTYNLSAMSEYLGHYYPVRVNRSQRYRPGSLDDASVLVLKTPTLDFEPEEVETILAFVRGGGGLVLIGDHTNLMGTSSRLNQFAVHAGMAFVFDGVSNGHSGSFSFAPPPTTSHAIRGRDTAGSEFLTGCSLRLAPGVDPLLVAPRETRVRGDYANGSFFGTLYNDPRSDIAPVAHGAAGTIGDGTVFAYSDSTCLSSFGIFQYGRIEAMVRAIDFCARGGKSGASMRWLGFASGSLVCLIGLMLLRRWTSTTWLLAVLVSVGLSPVAARHLVEGLHERAWPDPQPVVELPHVDYISRNTNSLLPPVLGSSREEWLPRAYDTLYAAIPRTGRFPNIAGSLSTWTGEHPAMFLDPVTPVAEWVQQRTLATLRRGGRMLVGVSSASLGFDTTRSLLAGTSLGIEYQNEEANQVRFTKGPGDHYELLAGGKIQVYETAVGEGRLILVIGIENWARSVLGHAFSIPDADAAELYASLFRVLSRLGPDVIDRRTYLID
ncbi:MAG: hypothetical protein ACE37K_17035 [Planctomycetota bacterium]